jgi:hypothetical protein
MIRPSTIASGRRSPLDRLIAARATVAQLVVEDPIYAPIFERLEAEIAVEEAKLIARDPLATARAIIAAQRSGARV